MEGMRLQAVCATGTRDGPKLRKLNGARGSRASGEGELGLVGHATLTPCCEGAPGGRRNVTPACVGGTRLWSCA